MTGSSWLFLALGHRLRRSPCFNYTPGCRGRDDFVNTPTRASLRRGSIAAACEQMACTHDDGGSESGSIVNAEDCGAGPSCSVGCSAWWESLGW